MLHSMQITHQGCCTNYFTTQNISSCDFFSSGLERYLYATVVLNLGGIPPYGGIRDFQEGNSTVTNIKTYMIFLNVIFEKFKQIKIIF